MRDSDRCIRCWLEPRLPGDVFCKDCRGQSDAEDEDGVDTVEFEVPRDGGSVDAEKEGDSA